MSSSPKTRTCGDVALEIAFDKNARVHPKIVGACRVKVIQDGELVDTMTVGASEQDLYDDARVDEIAETALRFTLGDKPTLRVRRDDAGQIVLGDEP